MKALLILIFSAAMVMMTMGQTTGASKVNNIPTAKTLIFPVTGYKLNDSWFLHEDIYDGELWGEHLGEDTRTEPGKLVMSIGDGVVVHSANHPGVWEAQPDGSRKRVRNWGNLVIIAHKNPKSGQVFLSLYGHLGERYVKKGQTVTKGEVVGDVGQEDTPENGLWHTHLHWAIYVGPYPWHTPQGKPLKVLPGYFKAEQGLTTKEWWAPPSQFVQNYPNG